MTMRIVISLILVFLSTPVLAEFDWAYELSEEAKEIYRNKTVQYPCSQIAKMLDQDDTWSVYMAIRDAGLFREESCSQFIEMNRGKLEQEEFFEDVIAFYELRMGKMDRLQVLADSFDAHARRVGDHLTVELFGFLGDWDVSGLRLVRHSDYADGAAAELLCSAILWRRFIHGNDATEANWKKVLEKEKVNKERSLRLLERCR